MTTMWLVLSGCATLGAAPLPDSAAALKANTQALLDAIAPGDRATWDRLLDPRLVYVSEDGTVETKASLLGQLDPLPPGLVGHISLARFELSLHGDTAVVLHVDEESLEYHGQHLGARYVTLATWRYSAASGWRLIASQVLAALTDPPAVGLTPAQLDEYVGTYRLTDTIRYELRREGAQLVGQRTGRSPQPLQAELRDLFFAAGQPRSRKVFLRDESGRVTGFADRREGRDIVWLRMP